MRFEYEKNSCIISANVELRLPPYNTPITVPLEEKSSSEDESGDSRLRRLLRRRRKPAEEPERVSDK